MRAQFKLSLEKENRLSARTLHDGRLPEMAEKSGEKRSGSGA